MTSTATGAVERAHNPPAFLLLQPANITRAFMRNTGVSKSSVFKHWMASIVGQKPNADKRFLALDIGRPGPRLPASRETGSMKMALFSIWSTAPKADAETHKSRSFARS